jgi:glycosyltransferase involved in cell wall biosynthesis
MLIAFDGTTLRPQRTGVGYYTEHLLHHLAEARSGDELTILSNRPVDTIRPLPSRIRVAATAGRIPRLVWMQTTATRLLRKLQPDVAHFTNGMVPFASPVPTVVTIHDMSLTMYPRYHPVRRVVLNRPLVDFSARRADAIITVSQSAKRDIIRLYGIPSDRVHVIHEAAAPTFGRVTSTAELERVRQRYSLADRFILYVGTIEPRKNLPSLIEGFARRSKAGDLPHQLVCVGPYGWLSRDIERHIERLDIRRAVRFTGYVPFGDLPALYTMADLFVFPSLYEGFGLPVIEAMACGTPVITGRVAALEEVAGGAVEHIDHLDPATIGGALVALARSRERREQLRACGLARAKQFSWQRAAQETLAVYRRAARGAGAWSAASAEGDVAVAPASRRPVAIRESEPWMFRK